MTDVDLFKCAAQSVNINTWTKPHCIATDVVVWKGLCSNQGYLKFAAISCCLAAMAAIASA